MQSLIRSKSAGVTGGRGTAGAGPGRDVNQQTQHMSPSGESIQTDGEPRSENGGINKGCLVRVNVFGRTGHKERVPAIRV